MLPLYRAYCPSNFHEVDLASLLKKIQEELGTPDIEVVMRDGAALEVIGVNPDVYDGVVGNIGWIYLQNGGEVCHPEGCPPNLCAGMVLDFVVEPGSDIIKISHMWTLLLSVATFMDVWFWLGAIRAPEAAVGKGRAMLLSDSSYLVDKARLLAYALGWGFA